MAPNSRHLVAIAATAALSMVGLLSTADYSAAAQRYVAGPALSTPRPDLRVSTSKPPIYQSTSFAGYTSEEKGLKAVLATLEVPLITKCGATADSGVAPVVIVEGSKYFVGAGAEASCQNGARTYRIAVNYNGSETKSLTVKPEDEITVYIATSSKSTTVKITDLTSHQKTSQTVPGGVATAALIGDDTLEQGGTKQQLPIPSFTDHKFTFCKVNARALSTATPLIDEELVKGKTLLIQASALLANGTGFWMYFKNAI